MADAGCADSTCTNTTCATCQPTCYSEQSFCTITGKSAISYYSHDWPESFSKNEIIYNILPRKIFNSAFTYINSALSKGNSELTGGITSSWEGTAETRDFIYADKVNELLEGLSKFSNKHSIPDAVKDTIITAAYFTDIAEALNAAELSSTACDNCNTACNVTCKECQGCVACQGCNTCEGHTTCHSPCHSPCDVPAEGGT